jgi:hypothetical protein
VFERTSAGASTYPILVRNGSSTSSSATGIEFNADSSSSVTALIRNIKNSGGDYSLVVDNYNGGGLSTNNLVLRGANVGIGVSNPQAKLDIAGHLLISTVSVTNPTVDGQITGPFLSGTSIVFKSRTGGTIYTHTLIGV